MPALRTIPRQAWVAGAAVVIANLLIRGIQLFGAYGWSFLLGDLLVFVVETGIWASVAVAAVASPRTRRFGWLVVGFQWLQPWILGHIPGDLWWSLGWATGSVGYAILVHLVVSFPSGRLASWGDRAIVLAGYVVWSVPSVVRMWSWDPDQGIPCDPATARYCARNVFLTGRDDELVARIDGSTAVLVGILGVLTVLAIVRHARAASPAGRRALLYVAAGASVQAAMTTVDMSVNALGLWEIRTFTQSVAATLLWDALPVSFLAGLFAARLARGRVAMLAMELAGGVPTGGLRALLARTLRDPSVTLAFPSPDGIGLVDGDGHPVIVPAADDPTRAVTRLEREGELLALLVHDPAIDEGDPDLVPAVGSVAQMALANERLAAQVKAQLEEVRASRSRIVEATDAERRRVERALHDGAQARLVALAMRLEAARLSVADASDLIDRTTEELGLAIAEVRRLASGLHPTILTESGLRAAVDALAERTPVPVTVEIPEARYPLAVEVTAYYVIAEAVTNVAKYAAATGILVRVLEVDGRLQVVVEDDGRGGADPAAGSGLRGLLDRVAAAGGSLLVDSPAGAGTRIRAEVPVG